MNNSTGQVVQRTARIDMLNRRLGLYRRSIASFLSDLIRKKSALLGLLVFIALIIVTVFPQFFAPYEPTKIVGQIWEPPSLAHLFGTDDVGRDVLSQLIYGTRTSMFIGFIAAFLSLMIGGTMGIVSGFYGGIVDQIMMRITEFFMVIPGFPLMVVLAFVLRPSVWTIILAITLVVWQSPVRIIRSEVLTLRERLYVKRARVIGNSNLRLLLRYILPRVLPLGLAVMVIAMGWAIPSEAFLSWMGLGDPINISWGMILYYAFGRGSFTVGAWWHFIPPGAMILLVITSFHVLGNGMQEVINPKLKAR